MASRLLLFPIVRGLFASLILLSATASLAAEPIAPPTIEQICSATSPVARARDPVPFIRRSALAHLLPVQARLLNLASADALGSIPKAGGGYEKLTEANVLRAIDLPSACRSDASIVGLHGEVLDQARKNRPAPAGIRAELEALTPSLVADAILHQRLRRELNARRLKGVGRAVGGFLRGGMSAGGPLAASEIVALGAITDPIEKKLAELEVRNQLLATHPNQSAQPLSELLTLEVQTAYRTGVDRYLKTPPDELDRDLDRDFRRSRFVFDALPNRARLIEMAEQAHASLVRSISDQSGALCRAGVELAGYDNLIYPHLFLASTEPGGPVSAGDLCRAHSAAVSKKQRDQWLQIAGIGLVVGTSVVTAGLSGLAGAGMGLVSTSLGLVLWGTDIVRYPGAERQMLIAQGLFHAKLAQLEQKREMESQLAWTLFGMVTGGLAAPADAAMALKSLRALQKARVLETADDVVRSGTRSSRAAAAVAEEGGDAMDDLFRRAVACGLAVAP